MRTKIASLWNDFVDILFPHRCPACGGLMTGTEYQVCTRCLVALPRVSAGGLVADQARGKFAAFSEVKSVQAFLQYHPKGKVQRLLRSLKYEGNRDLGLFLGRFCGTERSLEDRFPAADLLVPVPLHLRKLKERGYNQSEAFVHGLSEVFLIPVDASLLRRDVYTLSQTGKSKAARIASMQGSFSVRPGVDLSRLRIVLADDVLTTGATLEACVEALVEGGCKEIHIITIAAAQT